MFSPRRLALPAVLLTLMACGEQTTDPVPGDSQMMPSASTSQSAISGGIPSRAEDYGSRWRDMSDGDFWSYISEYDSTVVVGVKSPNESRGVWREHVLVSPAERGDAEQSIENISGVEILSRDTLLPVLHAKVLGQDALHTLRALGSVDYVEPNRMNMSLAGESGCDWPSKAAPNQTTASGDLLDLRYTAQDAQIDRAWRRSNGEGVTVGLTDTGIYEYQLEIVDSSEFTSGESTGRFLRLGSVIAAKDGHPEWHGDCSHGTRTAGVVAAPMNGKRTVGVAWKSNLVAIRQANEVWGVWGVLGLDATDAMDAIDEAATAYPLEPDSNRIVMMAWGMDESSGVADRIRWWYWEKGRLFIGASGTGVSDWISGVLFPAKMDEVVAVSAVDSDYSPNGEISYGPEIELTFVRDELTVGRTPDEIASAGGSSGATAAVTGIAALVWSEFPTESAVEIRQRLRESGNNYPNRSDIIGFGVPNAMNALGGVYGVAIDTTLVELIECEKATYTLTARHWGGVDTDIRYQWASGETTRTVGPFDVYAGLSVTKSVTVTDVSDGNVWERARRVYGPATCTKEPIM